MSVSAAAMAARAEPKTVITGEQMEMSGGGKIVIFTGGAKVSKGVNELTADKNRSRQEKNSVEAYGHVIFKTINKAKEPMRGTSEKAVYDIQNDSGELSGGRPELVYYANTSTGPITMRAGDIILTRKKKSFTQ